MVDVEILREMSAKLPDDIRKAIGYYDQDIILRNNFNGVGETEFLCYKRFCDDVARIPDADFEYTFVGDDMLYLQELTELLTVKQDKKTTVLKLRPFQCYIVASIVCWRLKSDPTCVRFREAYISMARKNGKSFLQAVLLLYNVLLSGLENSTFVIASVKQDTAFICFKYFLNLIESNEDFDELFTYTRANGSVFCRTNGNEILVLSGNEKNDGLNVAGAICDELNLMSEKTLAGIVDATVNNRSACIIGITTAQPCLGQYHHINYIAHKRQLKNGTLPDDYLFICFEPDADLLAGEAERFGIYAIRQANPFLMYNTDGTRDKYHERMYLNKAENAKTQNNSFNRQNFITKQLNSFTCISDEYIDYNDIVESSTDLKIDDVVALGYTEWYLGIDLANTNDLSALCFLSVIKVADNKIVPANSPTGAKHIYLTCYNFMPAELLASHEQSDKYPYSNLAGKELILTTGCEGKRADYNAIVEFIKEQQQRLGITIKTAAADAYNIAIIQDAVAELVDTFICQPQGNKALSPYIEQVVAMTKNHEIHINTDVNNLYVAAVSNSVISRDNNNYCYIAKASNSGKHANMRIDSLDAAITGIIAPIIDMQHDNNSADAAYDEWQRIMNS